MERLESILVAIDRNDRGQRALAKALVLAAHFKARVELFLCDPASAYALKHEYDPRGVSEARETCLAESRRYLESLRASADVGALHVTIDVMCESPLYEGIVHKVQQNRPDLVIRSIGNGATETAGLSSTDWALLRTCPAPLMLTRGRPWKREPRIAAAVDISNDEALTGRILRTTAFLTSRCEGSFDVLYGEGATDVSAQTMESRRTMLSNRVAEAAVRPTHIHVLVGEPAKSLPEFAASGGYDVFVLGALTHRKALTALVGTLTGRLIETLDCDFLLLKPSTFVCPVGNASAGDT